MKNLLLLNSTFEGTCKFLESSKLLKLTQKETDNFNSPIAKEIEFVIIYLPTRKTTGLGDSTVELILPGI